MNAEEKNQWDRLRKWLCLMDGRDMTGVYSNVLIAMDKIEQQEKEARKE